MIYKAEKMKYNPHLAELTRIRRIYEETIAMGGPGSGRHPEGKRDINSILPDSPEVISYLQRARESGKEIEHIGLIIAREMGGRVSEIDYKSASSITRKCKRLLQR